MRLSLSQRCTISPGSRSTFHFREKSSSLPPEGTHRCGHKHSMLMLYVKNTVYSIIIDCNETLHIFIHQLH